ncbi:MAG: hypothetical protein ACTSRH_01510 [Promethearchaeota archaeon]
MDGEGPHKNSEIWLKYCEECIKSKIKDIGCSSSEFFESLDED